MYDVLLVALMAIFPVLLYLFIKWVAWLEFRGRTLPDLRMRMDTIRDTLEAFVAQRVEPTDPARAAAIRRGLAEDRQAFSDAARVGGFRYLFGRPGLERRLEALVRDASARSQRERSEAGKDPVRSEPGAPRGD